ncbi:MAG TPA: hypothetical protein VIX35_03565, partial [Vicinamibacterales bacterium]
MIRLGGGPGVLLAAILFAGRAGQARAELLETRPARGVTLTETTAADSTTTRFVVEGIPVILRRVMSNDVISANVYLLGGVRQATPKTAGIEPFLLDVSERGTAHYPRDVLRHVMARLGTSIVVDPGIDWTSIG